ncbi:LacI family transcriptional regulator [Pseudarthrobacter sp. R1]|uniref:LacI family DNA-binding transcriptional regulator n=1 Tax=Pseudarthrobacter sp. R1 TaxID=2944934 RepID=UPI00210AA676|nr:LacI family DNA-binding transcriptional regulator [Pseudarthrobacter sp. R1]MCQ6271441.1 LacI family transcriptional regulator [Pseudarthrobacter sp. R1]
MKVERAPRATSWDVARLTGLSRTTVSQILNGRDARFPQETRDRVSAAARELNYRPSRAGRALVSGVSDLVVIVLPNFNIGRRFQEIVERYSAEVEAHGLNALVRYAGSDVRATLTTILDLRPAAVYHFSVFDADAVGELRAAGVQVLPEGADRPDPSSRYDRMLGRVQCKILLRVPERRLLYAAPADPRVGPYARLRAGGLAEGAADVGADQPRVIAVPSDLEGAISVLGPTLSQADGPLGIACYDDEVAIAVLAVARSLGLKVPERVGVVGVDGIDIGQLIQPRLTTIAINTAALEARFSAELNRLLGPRGRIARAGRKDSPAQGQEEESITVIEGESC